MRVQITPTAHNDLKEIHAYITDEFKNPQAAINVVSRITKRLRSLFSFPAMGAPLSSIINVETDYRFLVCGNYTVFYRYDSNFVNVIRVLYSKRDFVNILFGKSIIFDDETD